MSELGITQMRISGRVFAVLRDKFGKIKEVRETRNLIVTTGLNLIASALGQSGLVGVGAEQIGLGEDSGAMTSADTTISTEVGSRVLASYAKSAPNWYESAVFGSGVPGGGGSIRQCGILTSATGGTLFAKGSFAVVNKAISDSLTIVWTFSLA